MNMKHILEFNTFETDSSLFKRVDKDYLFSLGFDPTESEEKIKIEQFSKMEFDIISSHSSYFRAKFSKNAPLKNSIIYLTKKGLTYFIIWKIRDGWFLLEDISDEKYFICDQIDGLISCYNDCLKNFN